MTTVRRLLVAVAVLLLLSWGGMVAWLVANEQSMVFQPDGYGGRTPVPLDPSLGLTVSDTMLPGDGGIRLGAWIIRGAADGPWLLFCHGNAGNVTLARRQRYYADLAGHGFNILAFDYRGFGASSDDAPSEAGLYADAAAAYRFLRDSLAVPPERIVIYGHSLGGGVATELASRVPAAGLILEGTFTSVPDVGRERYPFLPIGTLARNRFDNATRIAALEMPILILHASADGTIPFRHGERLQALAARARLVPLGGDHDSAWEQDRDRYMAAFAGFVSEVVPTPASPVSADR